MLLKKIKIDDFKRIHGVELPLSEVNILVGANASGKSSIIQAIHLAVCVLRQSERVDPAKTSTVGIDELDYLPSDNYRMLGHRFPWGNKEGSPSSKIEFTFGSDTADSSARCTLRSARNAGISITGQVPSELTPLLRAKQKFFSAYIPGISGIPNKEEKRSKKVVLKACSYGDSNVILRNVLFLLKLQNELATVERWISEVVGEVKLYVDYNEDRDLAISCSVEIDSINRPIELTGTGYLQLIQMFSYVLLFEPGILLIDEPDIHLHPSVQEKLVSKLEEIAKDRKLRILLTTHSPFIVRAASPAANIFWIKDGALESTDRQQLELALGWGAFGKKVLIISEDTDTSLLRKLISQWPEIGRLITFYPGTGFKNLPTPQQAKEVGEALGGKFKILVHRDRDSITDSEAAIIIKQYADLGVDVWLPEQSDVEGYFCEPYFIAELVGCSLETAQGFVTDALTRNRTPIEEQFAKQRAAHNQEFYRSGGSPTNDDVWTSIQRGALNGAKGKFVFKQLKNIIPNGKFSETSIAQHEIRSHVAMDLATKLRSLL